MVHTVFTTLDERQRPTSVIREEYYLDESDSSNSGSEEENNGEQ